jgi:hypothetical protein
MARIRTIKPDQRSETVDLSFIYVIGREMGAGSVGPTKIGVSDAPRKRADSINTSCPFRVKLFQIFACPTRALAFALEGCFSDTFADRKLNGEWYDMTVQEAALAVGQCITFSLADAEDIPEFEAFKTTLQSWRTGNILMRRALI